MKLAEPQRLYRRIAERIRGGVLRGEWPVGTRLPPERDLSLALGVSRPSLREALIALEVDLRIADAVLGRGETLDTGGQIFAEGPCGAIETTVGNFSLGPVTSLQQITVGAVHAAGMRCQQRLYGKAIARFLG